MKIYIDLIHSYQYIKKKNYMLKVNNFITDKDNNNLIGLCNIPKDSLYKIFLQKIDNSKSENLKIMIRINFKNLSNYIKNGKNIPERDKLFKLLRRTFFNKKNLDKYLNENISYFKLFDKHNNKINYNQIIKNWINKTENSYNEITILNNDVIKIHDIYIDTHLERFYLNKDKILSEKILFNGGIIFYNPIIFNESIFIENKNIISKKNSILDNNTTLILGDTLNIDKWKIKLQQNNLSYLIINSKNNITKYSYNDIVNIDYLLINFTIFNNNTYTNLWNHYTNYNQNLNETLETIKLEKLRNPKILNDTNIFYQLINFKRVIIDNFQFTEKNSEILNQIILFQGKNKWIINNKYNLNYNDLLNNIKLFTNNKIVQLDKNKLKQLTSFIKIIDTNKLFFNIKNILLELSEFEKKHYSYLIDNKIDTNEYLSLPENFYKYTHKHISESDIKSFDNKLCVICQDNINKNNIGLLNCSHYFCFTCVYNWNVSENNKKCPICRENINNIFRLVSKKENNNNFEIMNYSTKLITILKLIDKSNKNDNILFISKFDNTINNIINLTQNTNINFNNLNLKKNSNKSSKYNLINIKNIQNITTLNTKKIFFLESISYKDKYYLDLLYSKVNNNFNVINFNVLTIKNIDDF